MTQKLYAIKDGKGEFFSPPFLKHTHGEAERDFRTLAKDEKSTVFQYPEDFDLYYLGLYDNSTGKMQTLDAPQHIIKAANIPS